MTRTATLFAVVAVLAGCGGKTQTTSAVTTTTEAPLTTTTAAAGCKSVQAPKPKPHSGREKPVEKDKKPDGERP